MAAQTSDWLRTVATKALTGQVSSGPVVGKWLRSQQLLVEPLCPPGFSRLSEIYPGPRKSKEAAEDGSLEEPSTPISVPQLFHLESAWREMRRAEHNDEEERKCDFSIFLFLCESVFPFKNKN